MDKLNGKKGKFTFSGAKKFVRPSPGVNFTNISCAVK